MTLEPISAAKLIALMLAGGIFALAGLYMMLRPRPEGAAKIELFGLKFESSSAGLLVFLVGAGFLAVSLFVPEKNNNSRQDPLTDRPEVPSEQPPNQIVPLPAGADTKESEPNDSVQTADIIALGSTVSGKLRTKESDWFVLPTETLQGKRLVVKVRNLTGAYTEVFIYDEDEQKVAWEASISVEAMLASSIVSGKVMFIRLQNGTGGGNNAYGYELTTSVKDL